MNVGELDRRLILKQKTVSRDAWNHPVATFTTLATVWGKKLDRLAGEAVGENQLVATNRTEFTIRYRTDVTEDMIIEYDSENYYVTGTKEIGRKELLLITTELRDNA
jgi:SPP1 family predicted phage head-tail adaptor